MVTQWREASNSWDKKSYVIEISEYPEMLYGKTTVVYLYHKNEKTQMHKVCVSFYVGRCQKKETVKVSFLLRSSGSTVLCSKKKMVVLARFQYLQTLFVKRWRIYIKRSPGSMRNARSRVVMLKKSSSGTHKRLRLCESRITVFLALLDLVEI